jgi:hypothetical protein
MDSDRRQASRAVGVTGAATTRAAPTEGQAAEPATAELAEEKLGGAQDAATDADQKRFTAPAVLAVAANGGARRTGTSGRGPDTVADRAARQDPVRPGRGRVQARNDARLIGRRRNADRTTGDPALGAAAAGRDHHRVATASALATDGPIVTDRPAVPDRPTVTDRRQLGKTAAHGSDPPARRLSDPWFDVVASDSAGHDGRGRSSFADPPRSAVPVRSAIPVSISVANRHRTPPASVRRLVPPIDPARRVRLDTHPRHGASGRDRAGTAGEHRRLEFSARPQLSRRGRN